MPPVNLSGLALFGQAAPPSAVAAGLSPLAVIGIVLAGGAVLAVILVPVVLGLRQARIERELEHAERMKALELGLSLPKDAPFWSPLRLSAAIGAGVPVAAFGIAFVTTVSVPGSGGWFVWPSA